MKKTILVIAALLLTQLSALHVQTVTLKPSDVGLRVEIGGQLFSDYVTKETPRPFLYAPIRTAEKETPAILFKQRTK